MTAWTEEYSDYQPPELESDGTNDGLIQRKNIKHVNATEETSEHWECEMRFISVSEHEFLKAVQNIMNGGHEV